MKWFDGTQSHLHAEGQELFHLFHPSAPSSLGDGYSGEQTDPSEVGKGTHKEAYTNIIPLTTPHLQSCPPWRCRTGCIASCGVHTFCPKSREQRSRAHHEPCADHGQARSRPLTSVLGGVPVAQHISPAEPLNRKTKIPELRPADRSLLGTDLLIEATQELIATKDTQRELYTYRILGFLQLLGMVSAFLL